jgi:hypothetical protein
MAEKEYLQTPYGENLAYGKAKLPIILDKSLTDKVVKDYFIKEGIIERQSTNLWGKLFGQDNSIAEETVVTLPFKEVKSISTLNALSTQRVDLLSTDVVMGIINKFEKAVQISTQAYNLFINDMKRDENGTLISDSNALQNYSDFAEARYVFIQLETASQHLTYEEIEIYDPSGTNIALTGSAAQSSIHNGNAASNAIDGNITNSYAQTGDTTGVNQWWGVDLGSDQKIAGIRIYGYNHPAYIPGGSVYSRTAPFRISLIKSADYNDAFAVGKGVGALNYDNYQLHSGDATKAPVINGNQQVFNFDISNVMEVWSKNIRDIYHKNFNDGSDLSLYRVQGEGQFQYGGEILFTTRLGTLEFDFEGSIKYLVDNATKKREGRFMDAYATEFAIEMLQNCLIDKIEYDQHNLQVPLSCGFMIIKDPVSGQIQNIRLYSSYVFDVADRSGLKKLAISSGVNLFDFLDIAQFYQGVSSSNLAILMMNICDTLNRTNLDGFTESNTIWEFGPLAAFNTLKCVNSAYNPSWSGKLINECILAGTTVNIPARIYYIVEYLNTEFSTLQDNQTIIISFADGAFKVVSIIRISVNNNKITFQTKDARIDTLFPQNEINADTLIKGELQVTNYKGDMIMHVDPTTSSTTIMGKLGINQELHEIKGMLDVDNLSNTNMKRFIDNFTPFIRETIESMPYTLPTQQPISSDDVLDNSTTYYMPLLNYTMQQVTAPLSRAERFGKLQAIVEIPVRGFIIIDAYEILNKLNDNIRLTEIQIQKLEIAKSERIEEEEDAEKWALVADIAFTVVIVAAGIASAGAGSAGVAYGLAALSIAGSEVIERTDAVEEIGNVDGLTSEEIQQKIDNFISIKNSYVRQAEIQRERIKSLEEDIEIQASLLGLGDLYESYLNSQVDFINGTQLYAFANKYVTTQLNEIIEDTSFPSISGKYDTLEDEIDALLEAVNKTNEIGYLTDRFTLDDINKVLKEMKIDNFIKMYLEKTTVISDAMRTFINKMESHSSYSSEKQSYTFLKDFIVILGNDLDETRVQIKTGKSKSVNSLMVNKNKAFKDTETMLQLQEEVDAAQLYYNKEDYLYEVYTEILKLSNSHTSAGNHHSLNNDSHKHLASMVSQLSSKMPEKYGIDPARILTNFAYYTVGYGTRLNQFGSRIKEYFTKLQQEQFGIVKKAKLTLENLRSTFNEYTDELQDYVDIQNWDIETHNRLQQVISAWLKMFTIYKEEITLAIVVPVTDKTSKVGSIYYLKASIQIYENNNNPTLALSGRSLNMDEYTRDLSYRETLYTLVSALTSSCQLINYCTLFLEKDIDTAITDKIQSDALFTDRFDGTSLFVSVVDITNQKVIQNEEYPYWKGHPLDKVYMPNTNTKMSDIYSNTNTNFKEQYGFDPLSPNLSKEQLENVYIAPTKYDDTWRLVVMRFIVKTDFNTQVKTIYRVSCNINVNEYINQSIISRGDVTMYGDFTVKTSTDKEIFQIDTLNKTVSNIYPLGIGSQNPTTMLDINDTSISNIHQFIDTMSSKMKGLQPIYEYIKNNFNYGYIYIGLSQNYKAVYDYYIYLENFEVKNIDSIKDLLTKVDAAQLYYDTEVYRKDVYTEILNFSNSHSSAGNHQKLSSRPHYWLYQMASQLLSKMPEKYGINSANILISFGYTVGFESRLNQFGHRIKEHFTKLLQEQYVVVKEAKLQLETIATHKQIIDNRTFVQTKIMEILGSKSSLLSSELRDSFDDSNYTIVMESTSEKYFEDHESYAIPKLASRETFIKSVNDYLIEVFSNYYNVDWIDDIAEFTNSNLRQPYNYYREAIAENVNIVKLISIIMNFIISFYIKKYIHYITNNTDQNLYYLYELPTDATKNAGDISIIHTSLNPKWIGHTFQNILDNNIDNDLTNIIKLNIVPSLQDILDKQLLYDGSVYVTLYPSINGDNYTVNTVFLIENKLLVLGSGIDIQQFNININNPNVSTLLNKITQNIISLNYNYYNYTTSNDVSGINYVETDKYLSLFKTPDEIFDLNYTFTLVPSVTNLLNNKVDGTEIKNVTNNLKKELSTSFMVNYTKNDSKSSFGIVNARDNNNDYIALYYKYRDNDGSTKLQTYYLNITNKLFVSSVNLNGDMSITGQLELFKNNKEEKFITIDPENSYLGINTNDRFLNYELEYQTTSSIYNSKHHVIAFSDSYPNVAFERQSETKEDSNDPDYSRFGSYSSSTMVRVSKLWDYDEIMKRVDLLNGSNIMKLDTQKVTYNESEFNWHFHRTYGPDISFEIKDKSDVNVELGQLKMVIDKRENKTIHAGFGVQVVDTKLSTGFEGSLKNILYVNNDSQLFVEGVWLGGKLFHMKEGNLMWGDNIIFKPTPTPV